MQKAKEKISVTAIWQKTKLNKTKKDKYIKNVT